MQQRTNPSNILIIGTDCSLNWENCLKAFLLLKPQLRNAFPNRAHRSHSTLVRSHDLAPNSVEFRDRFASPAVHASVFEHRRSDLVQLLKDLVAVVHFRHEIPTVLVGLCSVGLHSNEASPSVRGSLIEHLLVSELLYTLRSQ